MARMWIALGVVALLVAAGGVAWLIANGAYRQQQEEAEAAWRAIAARAPVAPPRYDPAMVADLPEIARRYFNHAIAPGTPLSRTVELRMEGQFRLGDRAKSRTFEMRAHQLLAAPSDYIWNVDMQAGPIRISGSDGRYNSHAWMRMWMFRAIPLVQVAATEDLDRSALARPALEAIWAPAALLPDAGAQWVELAPDKAKVTIGQGEAEIDMTLTIDPAGRVVDIVARRWSDANPQQVFRYQPFGGTVEAEASFGGFTIPSAVEVGNHYGRADYFAFFKARIVAADYL
jgi:hypothetical protein